MAVAPVSRAFLTAAGTASARNHPNGYRSDDRQGNTHRIVGVTVAAARHHETLTGVIHHLGFASFNKCLGTFLITYIHILTVFYRKGFNDLIVL